MRDPRSSPTSEGGGVAWTPDTAAWHGTPSETVVERLASSMQGISTEESHRRRESIGPNRIPRGRPTPWWRILLAQFTGLVVLLLVAAALVSLAIGEVVEAAAIAGVLLINATIGFAVELRARRTMDALLAFEATTARVRRPGGIVSVGSADLVPGDVVELEEGDAVPADGRLLARSGLRVDESALTGESLPVEKHLAPLPVATSLAERTSMIHSGTTVVGGRGVAVVTATGARTEVGQIGRLLTEVQVSETPLERRLDALGRRLVGVTMVVAAVTVLVGIVRGLPLALMIETGIALAIAAVPEGLPAVATITLAMGLRRMARRNALVRRLAAVEALGSTTVVCTDKTGTLTAGRMTVSTVAGGHRTIGVTGTGYSSPGTFLDGGDEIDPASVPWLWDLLASCALTNRAVLADGDDEVMGDPTDAALLVLARKAGLDAEALGRQWPRVGEIPFDSDLRLSASVHRHGDEVVAHVKGALGAILGRAHRWASDQGDVILDASGRDRFSRLNRDLAARGLRVIAVARGRGDDLGELTLLGLVGIIDPPAEGVKETVAVLAGAGVDTVLITGDQRSTAAAIAASLEVGSNRHESLEGSEISDLSDEELRARCSRVGVYSRVVPRDKVRIVAALQSRGEVVAMIGDGVNDAAALKQADVGVAMGGRGTDVAKEASAIVLTDDRFSTIGVAVEEGRVIYDNIRKFVFYLFSCNLAEVATILVAGLVGAPMPLTPLQILWLNLVTDTFPALALAMEPGEPDVMRRAPIQPETTILSRGFIRSIAFYALLITAVTLMAFAWGLATGPTNRAATLAFVTLALAQLFHLGNARSRSDVLSPTRIVANPWAVASVPFVLLLQVAAVHWSPLSRLLGTVPLTAPEWAGAMALAAVPATLGQALRLIKRRRDGRSSPAGGSPDA